MVKTCESIFVAIRYSLLVTATTVISTAIPASALKPRHIVQLLMLSLIWGSAYLFTRSAVPEFGPITLVTVRMSIAVMILLPILAARGGLPLLRQHALVAIVLGALYLAESITLQVVIGCIIVLLGTALSVGLFPRSTRLAKSA